jgi:undecaprenyl-diphosphatase
MNEIFEFLLSMDRQIFLFANNNLANPVFDFLMPLITNKKNWLIPIGITWILLIWRGGRRGRIVAFLIIPILILADQTSSSLLKHTFDRLRPCKVLENVRLLIPCGSGYSFPSSHATNISAAFVLFIYYYSKYTIVWVTVILLIGFSRIYVGVHYPLDVLGGFVVGTTISILFILSFRLVERRMKPFIV